jgi:mRNA-degrading endonuclease toxin of MazEF toxin-antitoxin module
MKPHGRKFTPKHKHRPRAAVESGQTPRTYPRLSVVRLSKKILPCLEEVCDVPAEKNRPWLVVQSNFINPTMPYHEIMVAPFTTAKDGQDHGTLIYVGNPPKSGLTNPSSVHCDKVVSMRRSRIAEVYGYLEREGPTAVKIANALRVALEL